MAPSTKASIKPNKNSAPYKEEQKSYMMNSLTPYKQQQNRPKIKPTMPDIPSLTGRTQQTMFCSSEIGPETKITGRINAPNGP